METDRRRDSREGIAVVSVLAVMLAVTLLSHAVLLLARFEASASQAGVDVLHARLAAERGVARLIGLRAPPASDSAPLWAPADSLQGATRYASYTARYRRLSREVWSVAGEGTRGVARWRAQRLVRVLDPVSRALDLAAVISVAAGGVLDVSGAVDGRPYFRADPSVPTGSCPTWSAATTAGRTPSGGLPPNFRGPAWDRALAPLDFDVARGLLPDRVSGDVSPGPVASAGVCDANAAGNWGDPGMGPAPCRGRAVRIVSEASIRVHDGRGQGLLLVDGDLELTNVHFHGLIIVRGQAYVRGTTVLRGAIQARDGVEVESGAIVTGSACWVAEALREPLLRRPVPLAGARWIRGS